MKLITNDIEFKIDHYFRGVLLDDFVRLMEIDLWIDIWFPIKRILPLNFRSMLNEIGI